MSPPPANAALVRPAVHNQRSDPAMHAYNSFVEQIMAQKTEEWAHKETVLERQIRLLQTQLADEQKRSSETAARAEEETRKGEDLRVKLQHLAEKLSDLAYDTQQDSEY